MIFRTLKMALESGDGMLLIINVSAWPLSAVILAMFAAAMGIGLFGSRLIRSADELADMTGIGEALLGGVFLGAVTSLPGIITSVTAAASGHTELSISNAIGGIAAQTMFLALADMAHRRANLEHAASSLTNMLQGALLVVLLSAPLIAMAGPEFDILGIHPMSVILLIGYGLGMCMVSRSRRDPMWKPRQTPETRCDVGSERCTKHPLAKLRWLEFATFGAMVALCGFIVAQSGIALSEQTGISEAMVGGLFTAVCTSLPELVTSIAAVRQGALTLAVGGIIGGNCFDVLFVSFADFAYRDGSIYHAISNQQIYIIALSQMLTGILLLGLLRRQKHGIGNIGFESFLILTLYIVAFLWMFIPR